MPPNWTYTLERKLNALLETGLHFVNIVGKGAQIYLCRHPLYDTKGIKQNPTDKLFCLCQTKNDGKLYVKCETCNVWFHPTCVFPKKHLALTLTKEQWALCRCVCKGKTVSTSGSKVILYHNTANHSTTQTPAIARLSSPEHKNKTKPSQDKILLQFAAPAPPT